MPDCLYSFQISLSYATPKAMRLKNAIHQIGKYTFDPKNYLLTYDEKEKKRMTAKEAQILTVLLEHKGGIVKREDILKMFWADSDFFTSRSLDTFITKIRNLLSKDSSVSITNVKATGLILDFD
jgi:DNA-binding response OmpR family regulator